MMSLSVAILAAFAADSFMLPAIAAACMAPVAIFIVTRRSSPLIQTSS